eukprot:4674960-Amphidinium_carterae.1
MRERAVIESPFVHGVVCPFKCSGTAPLVINAMISSEVRGLNVSIYVLTYGLNTPCNKVSKPKVHEWCVTVCQAMLGI